MTETRLCASKHSFSDSWHASCDSKPGFCHWELVHFNQERPFVTWKAPFGLEARILFYPYQCPLSDSSPPPGSLLVPVSLLPDVYTGLWGYNSLLTAGGLSFFLQPTPHMLPTALIGALMTVVTQAALLPLFLPVSETRVTWQHVQSAPAKARPHYYKENLTVTSV